MSWTNPYFRNSNYSLSLSGYLFNRDYFDYDERRLGGRVGFGRELNDYLSINYGLRMETVKIDNLRVNTSAQLNAAEGNSDLFLASVGLVYDTRVFPYLTGVGSYLGLKIYPGRSVTIVTHGAKSISETIEPSINAPMAPVDTF